MIEVYGLDGNAQNSQAWELLFEEQNYARLFSDYRLEKIRKCKKEEARRQSIAAGWLLDQVLRKHGMTERDARFRTGAHGKRLLYLPDGTRADVNLSHSGSYVVCAYSADGAVGIDAECVREDVRALQIAKRFFAPEEYAWLDAQKNKAEAFCRLWTRKESFVKRQGNSLAMRLDRLLVLEPSVSPVHKRDTGVFFKEYERANCKITVCAGEADFPEQIEWQKISEKSLAKP